MFCAGQGALACHSTIHPSWTGLPGCVFASRWCPAVPCMRWIPERWWIWLWTEPRGTLAATANVWENQKLAHTEQTKQTPTKIRTDSLLQTVDRVVKGEEPVKDYKRHFIHEKCCLFYQQHFSSGRLKLLWGPVHSEVADECVIWKCEMQWLATCCKQ